MLINHYLDTRKLGW